MAELAGCRYGAKKRYDTRADARRGALSIKAFVESRGLVYDTLYPYPCPDDFAHWHLSHYQQGYATCPACNTSRVQAWKGGPDYWVIGAHAAPLTGQPCPGEKQRVTHRVEPIEAFA
jgi:hypothetical protein